MSSNHDRSKPSSGIPDQAAVDKQLPIAEELQVDVLLRAADLHLQRAINLAKTEWNVTLLFWGALITSGISFLSFSAHSEPPLAEYIAHNDWIIMLAYLLAAVVFLFGFSINQATSIKEERAQYQACVNEAAELAKVKAEREPASTNLMSMKSSKFTPSFKIRSGPLNLYLLIFLFLASGYHLRCWRMAR